MEEKVVGLEMCGIVGLYDIGRSVKTEVLLAIGAAMSAKIKHRGPDSSGEWLDNAAHLMFGHRRLSILDLSPTGNQPMISHDGRHVIVFNGEIYNHHSIRAELNSISQTSWRGTSDTEIMLEAISIWGVERALNRFNGMFAFAVWDRANRTLVLARDRFGEKPLYYGWIDDCFVFASELKSLLAAGRALKHSSTVFEIDREALALFMRYHYVPAPWTIYRGIRKLPPAHYLCLNENKFHDPMITPYWNLNDLVLRGLEQPFEGCLQEGIEELERRMQSAVSLRMESDVPLGAFLSGGIDSTTVVAMMQAQSSRPIRTFTIKFAESVYDESASARLAAQCLGTEHTEMLVTAREALETIPKLPWIYDEPFGDASQVPMYIVSHLTRRHITVALSGDGGDEIFAGYYRHFMAPALWQRIRRLPLVLRQWVANLGSTVPDPAWDNLFLMANRMLGASCPTTKVSARIDKIFKIMRASNIDAMYRDLLSYWSSRETLRADGLTLENPKTSLLSALPSSPIEPLTLNGIVQRIMLVDALTYLPDDILVKVDRASMAVSLESRAPFLDHELVAFAWTLPLEWKIHKGKGKWILRQILRRHVPEECFERPKTGFAVPIEYWLRNSLRDWVESLIDETRLRNQGLFDPTPIRRAWREHLTGLHARHYHLWPVMMFQSWLEHYKSDVDHPRN